MIPYKLLIYFLYVILIIFTFRNTKQNKWNFLLSLTLITILILLELLYSINKIYIIELVIFSIILLLTLNNIYKEIYLDELTQISNRKILKKLNKKIKLNKTCFILYDVDKFKNINDTYGHITGDQTLINIANILKSNVKNKKNIIRFGGDEFLIFYKFKDKKEIKDLINQINKSINSFNSTSKIKISLSNGYEVIHEKEDFNNFIEKLDQHLYETKKNKSHS